MMKLEAYQGVLLTVALGWGGLGALSAVGSALGHEVWLLMLPAGLIGVLLFFFYRAWLKRAGTRSLTELTTALFGPRAGRFVLALHMAYLLFVASYFLLAGLDLWLVADGQRAPLAVYALLTLVLCLLASRLGLAVLGRLSLFLVGLYMLVAVMDTLFLLPYMEWQRILPLSVNDWPRLLEDAAYIGALLFALLPLTLLLLPRLKEPALGPKCLALGLALAFADVLIANLRNVFLFGDMLRYEDYPIYQALRLVEWGNGLLRLELPGLLATLGVVFLCAMICLWGLNKLLSAVLARRSPYLLWLAGGAVGAVIWCIKSQISFIDNSVLLVALSIGALAEITLLYITLLKLQKSNCQKN